jgi:(S)-3,5-dihydroxyphenylglycine transaminase
MSPEIELKPCFGHPLLDVMNFLNEVVLRHPGAISFAPGRPTEQHFDVEGSLGKAKAFVAYRAQALGWTEAAVWNDLGQYNRTNGIINDLIARQLRLDEGIEVEPAAILVTHGCQEAMVVLLLGLFEAERDVLLVSDPTYIGITGLAAIAGIEIRPVAMEAEGLPMERLKAAIAEVRAAGKRPRAFYHIPDFNNPLGSQMPLAERHRLLGLLREEGVLLFEDNPYGMFAFDREPLPTLKQLDKDGLVIYLGSFAKTLYPGLRVGYLVADQLVAAPGGPAGKKVPLAVELSKVKSLTTVNTSPLLQAIAGAILLENDFSLRAVVKRKLPFYRDNRDRMQACLEKELGGRPGIAWNRPAGGFFMTVDVPFVFGDAEVEACARDYGVIVCPVSYFALTPGRERQVRLSFSYVSQQQIEEGIGRFARFLRERS